MPLVLQQLSITTFSILFGAKKYFKINFRQLSQALQTKMLHKVGATPYSHLRRFRPSKLSIRPFEQAFYNAITINTTNAVNFRSGSRLLVGSNSKRSK